MTRRQWIGKAACAPVWVSAAQRLGCAAAIGTRIGVNWESYRLRARSSVPGPDGKGFADALSFLAHCQELGAGGMQVPVDWLEAASPGKVRRAADSAGMYVEASVQLPRDQGDLSRFQDVLRTARRAGASVVRASLLNGLRFEMFDSIEGAEDFARQSWKSLTMAEPLLRKRRMRLAVENFGDLRLEELSGFVENLNSEFVGVCIDLANGLPLLEPPLEVVRTLAPYAYSVHLKDVVVEEYENGFRVSEVPLGEGVLDLRRLVQQISQARPEVRFNVDHDLQDPLDVPCLTEGYWASLPRLPGWRVAQTLSWVRRNRSSKLPARVSELSAEERARLEEENVKKSLAYARDHLRL